METYRHSGAVPLTGLLRAVATGLIVAGVLGVIYSYLIVYIPIIYINFLVTCVFGLAIGWTVGRAAKSGKIRNTFVVGWLGFVFGLAGLYVAWGADLLARIGLEAGPLAFHPRVLLSYVQWFYENGTWGLEEGENITGIMLAVIWLAEAGLIVGLATVIAPKSIASLSFCERCDQWTTAEEGVQELVIQEGQEPVVERILSGQVAALNELCRAPEGVDAYLRLDLARCETCSESNFLTIQMVTHTVDKHGNSQTKAEPLLSNLVLNEADVQAVREAGREMPEEEPEGAEESPEEDTPGDASSQGPEAGEDEFGPPLA